MATSNKPSVQFGTYSPIEQDPAVEEELAEDNKLYILASEIDLRYPEMYDAITGEQIVIAPVSIKIEPTPPGLGQADDPNKEAIDGIIGEIRSKVGEKIVEAADKQLEKSIRQYALLQLKKGNIATTDPAITHGPTTNSGASRKVSMKTVYSNRGEQIRLLMPNNFGYVKGGTVISTKGIDQVEHFSAKHWSRVSGIKGFLKNGSYISTLIELTAMTRAAAEGKSPDIPIPVPFANILLNMMYERTFGDMERAVDEQLVKNFNKLKSEGLEVVERYLFYKRDSSFVKQRGYATIAVKSETLAEILSGKETNMENVLRKEEYDNPDVTILYRKVENPKLVDYTYLIETLFIH